MTEKRFRVQEHCLRSSYGIETENWLVTNDNHCVVLNNKSEAHMVANMGNDVINKLNKLHEENNDLEEARSYYQENFLTMKTERHQLNDENKELKQSISDWQGSYDELYEDNLKLKKEINELKELVREADNELEIRDIVCRAGKFRLEEWGKHRYHQFYKGDEELEDESVVIMLMESEKENKQLQQELFESEVDYYTETFRDDYEDRIIDLKKEFKERFGRDFEYD